jgi:ABC-type nitrate/sulfonate/bicarbonate transport system substrate-binding protein
VLALGVIASREGFAADQLARPLEEVLDESWVPAAETVVDRSADIGVGIG